MKKQTTASGVTNHRIRGIVCQLFFIAVVVHHHHLGATATGSCHWCESRRHCGGSRLARFRKLRTRLRERMPRTAVRLGSRERGGPTTATSSLALCLVRSGAAEVGVARNGAGGRAHRLVPRKVFHFACVRAIVCLLTRAAPILIRQTIASQCKAHWNSRPRPIHESAREFGSVASGSVVEDFQVKSESRGGGEPSSHSAPATAAGP